MKMANTSHQVSVYVDDILLYVDKAPTYIPNILAPSQISAPCQVIKKLDQVSSFTIEPASDTEFTTILYSHC